MILLVLLIILFGISAFAVSPPFTTVQNAETRIGWKACPETNIDFSGNDLRHIRDITNWQTCAKKCSEESKCSFWTWVTPDYKVPSQRLVCYIKNSGAGRKQLQGVISGASSCQACPETNIDFSGNDLRHIRDITNWQTCAKKCSEESKCSFWTWVTPDYKVPSQRLVCYIKNSGAGRKQLQDVISGASSCQAAMSSDCLTSPEYPNHYPDNAHEIRTLTVAAGQHIEITFHHFDVEAESSCSYDYLLFIGVSRKLCGNTLPEKLTIPSNTARVLFHSDWSIRRKGYKFCYKPVNVKPSHNLCVCINPFTGKNAYRGNPDILCSKEGPGICYVECNGGCSDQKPTANPFRCSSKLACDVEEGTILMG